MRKTLLTVAVTASLTEAGILKDFWTDLTTGPTAIDVNLSKYQGKWYEIAASRLPKYTFEKGCECTFAEYSLAESEEGEKFVKVKNSCTRKGKTSFVEGKATPVEKVDESGNVVGKLTVDFSKPKKDATEEKKETGMVLAAQSSEVPLIKDRVDAVVDTAVAQGKASIDVVKEASLDSLQTPEDIKKTIATWTEIYASALEAGPEWIDILTDGSKTVDVAVAKIDMMISELKAKLADVHIEMIPTEMVQKELDIIKEFVDYYATLVKKKMAELGGEWKEKYVEALGKIVESLKTAQAEMEKDDSKSLKEGIETVKAHMHESVTAFKQRLADSAEVFKAWVETVTATPAGYKTSDFVRFPESVVVSAAVAHADSLTPDSPMHKLAEELAAAMKKAVPMAKERLFLALDARETLLDSLTEADYKEFAIPLIEAQISKVQMLSQGVLSGMQKLEEVQSAYLDWVTRKESEFREAMNAYAQQVDEKTERFIKALVAFSEMYTAQTEKNRVAYAKTFAQAKKTITSLSETETSQLKKWVTFLESSSLSEVKEMWKKDITSEKNMISNLATQLEDLLSHCPCSSSSTPPSLTQLEKSSYPEPPAHRRALSPLPPHMDAIVKGEVAAVGESLKNGLDGMLEVIKVQYDDKKRIAEAKQISALLHRYKESIPEWVDRLSSIDTKAIYQIVERATEDLLARIPDGCEMIPKDLVQKQFALIKEFAWHLKETIDSKIPPLKELLTQKATEAVTKASESLDKGLEELQKDPEPLNEKIVKIMTKSFDEAKKSIDQTVLEFQMAIDSLMQSPSGRKTDLFLSHPETVLADAVAASQSPEQTAQLKALIDEFRARAESLLETAESYALQLPAVLEEFATVLSQDIMGRSAKDTFVSKTAELIEAVSAAQFSVHDAIGQLEALQAVLVDTQVGWLQSAVVALQGFAERTEDSRGKRMADDIIVAISLLLEYTETSKELNKKQFMALHATVDPVFESAKSSIDQWKVYAETATPTELAEQVKIEAAQERVLIAKMKPIAEGLIEKLIDSIPLPPPASEVSSTQTAIFPVPPTSSVFLRGSAAASQEGVQKSGGSGNYWVLYASVDAEGEYSTVVVGDPYKANLFFLSRTPTITDTEFEKMKEAAKANHYFINIVGLIKTEQSPEVCKHAPELKDKVIFE